MPEKMSDSKNKTKRPRLSSDESYSSSSSSSQSSSSDDETDVKDLKPIGQYLANRTELASQLFKSVKTEKIRMMLPQILKKVDLVELEEWCAAELTGMSKKRITCIINDQNMLESSETDESDDSGPSLEIISDTEWISDNETIVKIEGVKQKNKKDSKKVKKKAAVQKNQEVKDKSKLKSKSKIKPEVDAKSNVKIKTEKIKVEGKPKEKEKEGESLLDLLELEMRARAIRALIRKEETPPDQKTAPKTNAEAGSSTEKSIRQVELKEQLEKIDVLMKHGDDEDVFVVIKPAPTIELISSESENEDSPNRVNKKLACQRKSAKKNVQAEKPPDQNNTIDTSIKDTNVNKEKDINEIDSSKEKDKEISSKKIEKQKESSNLPMSVSENSADGKQEQSKNPPEDLEEGEIVDDGEDITTSKEKVKDSQENTVLNKIKKVRKNPHIRLRKKSKNSDGDPSESEILIKKPVDSHKKILISKEKNVTSQTISEKPIEIEESPKKESEIEKIINSKENITSIVLDDDKSLDIEEIINLDDYPDDMDIIERGETNDDEIGSNKLTDLNPKETDKAAPPSSRSETWATRYVKQDDVQSVIKESKIQSEIRKRLRERQRQNKLNSSPKLNEEEVPQPSSELVIPKPTGSVEEYLALKKALASGKTTNIFENNINSHSSPTSSVQNESISRKNTETEKELLSVIDSTSTEVIKELGNNTAIVKKSLPVSYGTSMKVSRELGMNSAVEKVLSFVNDNLSKELSTKSDVNAVVEKKLLCVDENLSSEIPKILNDNAVVERKKLPNSNIASVDLNKKSDDNLDIVTKSLSVTNNTLTEVIKKSTKVILVEKKPESDNTSTKVMEKSENITDVCVVESETSKEENKTMNEETKNKDLVITVSEEEPNKEKIIFTVENIQVTSAAVNVVSSKLDVSVADKQKSRIDVSDKKCEEKIILIDDDDDSSEKR